VFKHIARYQNRVYRAIHGQLTNLPDGINAALAKKGKLIRRSPEVLELLTQLPVCRMQNLNHRGSPLLIHAQPP
jgi:hypothetical protein